MVFPLTKSGEAKLVGHYFHKSTVALNLILEILDLNLTAKVLTSHRRKMPTQYPVVGCHQRSQANDELLERFVVSQGLISSAGLNRLSMVRVV